MKNDQISKKETEAIIRELKIVIDGCVDGDVVEFGCYEGGTSIDLAKTIKDAGKTLYVYDSFEGLPEKTGEDTSSLGIQFKAGELFVSKKQYIKNLTRANVPMPRIKKAWFDDLGSHDVPDRICFAFLDGDYYGSIKTSLRLIENNLSKKAVIIVHDYANSALPGAKKAADEWLRGKTYKTKLEQTLLIVQI